MASLVQFATVLADTFGDDVVLGATPTPGNLLVMAGWRRGAAVTLPDGFEQDGVTGDDPHLLLASRVVQVGDGAAWECFDGRFCLMEFSGVTRPDDIVSAVLAAGSYTTAAGNISANPDGDGLTIGVFGQASDVSDRQVNVDDPPAEAVYAARASTNNNGPYASVGYLLDGSDPMTATATVSLFNKAGYVVGNYPASTPPPTYTNRWEFGDGGELLYGTTSGSAPSGSDTFTLAAQTSAGTASVTAYAKIVGTGTLSVVPLALPVLGAFADWSGGTAYSAHTAVGTVVADAGEAGERTGILRLHPEGTAAWAATGAVVLADGTFERIGGTVVLGSPKVEELGS